MERSPKCGAVQEVAAISVRDCERTAVASTDEELALEIGAPHRIRSRELAQLRTVTDRRSAAPSFSNEPSCAKDVSDGARHREGDRRVITLEYREQFARSPRGSLRSKLDNKLNHGWCNRTRVGVRSSRAIGERLKATVLVASEPLVTILATDPEALTLLGEC